MNDDKTVRYATKADEDWLAKLNEYLAWTVEHRKRPSIHGDSDAEKKLYYWAANQRNTYSTKKMRDVRTYAVLKWAPWMFKGKENKYEVIRWINDHKEKFTLAFDDDGIAILASGVAVSVASQEKTGGYADNYEAPKYATSGRRLTEDDYAKLEEQKAKEEESQEEKNRLRRLMNNNPVTNHKMKVADLSFKGTSVKGTDCLPMRLSADDKAAIQAAGFADLTSLEVRLNLIAWGADRIKLLKDLGISESAVWRILGHYNRRVGILEQKVSYSREKRNILLYQ